MFYLFLFLLSLALTASALFFLIRSRELSSHLRQAVEAWQKKEEAYTSELAKLEKIRHIPDIISRARRSEERVQAMLAEAQRRADEIMRRAVVEAQDHGRRIRDEADRQLVESRAERQKMLSEAEMLRAEARDALKVARSQ